MTKVQIAEPVGKTPRKSMHKSRRARLADLNGCRCAIKGCDDPGPYELDHVIALALGGSEEDRNLRLLCVEHHKAKTVNDAKIIAKCKRIEAHHTGTAPPSPTPLKSGRGFPKRWERFQ